jgi:RNA recognition motif-containing protein
MKENIFEYEEKEKNLNILILRSESNLNRDEIEHLFKKYGKIHDIFIPTENVNHSFITFETQEDAKKGLVLNGQILFGKKINVSLSKFE